MVRFHLPLPEQKGRGELIIYIAGKMRGLPDLGRAKFDATAERLREQGHIVLNPADVPSGMPIDRYMPICLAMVNAADAVYMLKGWGTSPGATLERMYAEYQGKKVFFEDGNLEMEWRQSKERYTDGA